MHLFVNNSGKMVDFLEYMVTTKPESCGGGAYTTLLEHYLHLHDEKRESEGDPSVRLALEQKVMAFLNEHSKNYDEDQALILCQRHSFRRGTLFLFERKGLYGQILSHHIQCGDVPAAVAACRKLGPQDPNLWVRALQYIAK